MAGWLYGLKHRSPWLPTIVVCHQIKEELCCPTSLLLFRTSQGRRGLFIHLMCTVHSRLVGLQGPAWSQALGVPLLPTLSCTQALTFLYAKSLPQTGNYSRQETLELEEGQWCSASAVSAEAHAILVIVLIGDCQPLAITSDHQ